MGTYASQEPGTKSPPSTNIRLSPVERANIGLINDPALVGFQIAGRRVLDDGFQRVSAQRLRIEKLQAQIAAADRTKLGHITEDVIFVGAEIETIELGDAAPFARKHVIVDKDNPYFSTDGQAIYNMDGTELVRLVVTCERYRVPEGCQRISDRAFDSMETLQAVELPSTLEEIGRLAFAKTGLAFIDVPGSVHTIGEKAFYCCRHLKACLLREGVTEIGACAFELSGLERLHIPASVSVIGRSVVERTPASRLASQGTITVDAAHRRFRIDDKGGLYQDGDFAELLGYANSYQVLPGTRKVRADAFCRKVGLNCVVIPEGVTEIGNDAFRGCRSLESVALPESLRSIGNRAFMDTRLKTLRISDSVAFIGEAALTVQGVGYPRHTTPLQHIDLDPQNPRFYLESGLLCERGGGEGGADRVMLYMGPESIVMIPRAVNRLAAYALLGARHIEELFVHGSMHSICENSLSVETSIPLVHVEIDAGASSTYGEETGGEPDRAFGVKPQTKRWITLHVPSFSPRFRNFTNLFATHGGRTQFVFPYFDAWVTNTRSVSEFALAAIDRLRCPVQLSEEIRHLYEDILRRKALAVCLFFAERGEKDALEELVNWGLLDVETIQEALDQSIDQGNAQATACLLSIRNQSEKPEGLDLRI